MWSYDESSVIVRPFDFVVCRNHGTCVNFVVMRHAIRRFAADFCNKTICINNVTIRNFNCYILYIVSYLSRSSLSLSSYTIFIVYKYVVFSAQSNVYLPDTRSLLNYRSCDLVFLILAYIVLVCAVLYYSVNSSVRWLIDTKLRHSTIHTHKWNIRH